MPTERIMPAAVDAEKAVLNGMLQSEKQREPLADLTADDFYSAPNRMIFETMLEMSQRGELIDPVTLIDTLGRKNQLASVGGHSYILGFADNLQAKGANLKAYTNMIRETSNLRRLITACDLATARALDRQPVVECSGAIEEAILEIESRRQGAETYHVKEFMPQLVKNLKKAASKGGVIGMTTGIAGLDRQTTGLRPGELWVIGALPGRGKTGIGVQMLIANAIGSVPGIMFSLEMSRFQVGCRLLAACSGVPAGSIRNPEYIGDAQWPSMDTAESFISKWPLWINDASRLKLHELLMRAKLYIRTRGVKLIVVDYLMLVDAPGRELREKADQIARGLKAIAKSENVTVVLLSQFKRPQNINDKPNETWFKESGGIEAEANVALALHRVIGEDGKFEEGKDEIIVVKQREGDRGVIPVNYDKRTLQFVDRTDMVQDVVSG